MDEIIKSTSDGYAAAFCILAIAILIGLMMHGWPRIIIRVNKKCDDNCGCKKNKKQNLNG